MSLWPNEQKSARTYIQVSLSSKEAQQGLLSNVETVLPLQQQLLPLPPPPAAPFMLDILPQCIINRRMQECKMCFLNTNLLSFSPNYFNDFSTLMHSSVLYGVRKRLEHESSSFLVK